MTTYIITWSDIAPVAEFLGIDAYGVQYGPLHSSCSCTLYRCNEADVEDPDEWEEIDSLSLDDRDNPVDFEDEAPYRLLQERLARRNGLDPADLVDATGW